MTFEEMEEIKHFAISLGYEVRTSFTEKQMFTCRFPESYKYATVLDCSYEKHLNCLGLIDRVTDYYFKRFPCRLGNSKKIRYNLNDINADFVKMKLSKYMKKYKDYITQLKLDRMKNDF